MNGIDRALTAVEVHERGLPLAGCCCVDHNHTWYERTRDGLIWLECYHCAEWRKSA